MNKKIHLLIPLTLCILFLSVTLSFAADIKPVAVKKSDKCPVCGMFVSGYRNWMSEIIFSDGTYAAFDGPKDMFRYYFNTRKYNPSKTVSDISAVYITEYYSTQLTDARKVFFVQGSNVNGPMGAELVPIASETAAKEFMKDHKGKKVMKFGEVTGETLK